MSEEIINEEVIAEESETEEIKDPKAFLKAHKQAKIDIEKYKSDLAALKEQLDDTTPKANKYKDKAIKAEAKLALSDLGIKNTEQVLKYLDLSDLDFDEEGNLPGVLGKVSELKKELPQLFSAKARAGNIDQFEDAPVAVKPKSATEVQYQQWLKGR